MLYWFLGAFFRCDRYSSLQASQQLEERSRRTSCVPEFVIFNEITATDGTHRRLCDPIGTMRIVSEIKEEWISHLIPQFTQVKNIQGRIRSLEFIHFDQDF